MRNRLNRPWSLLICIVFLASDALAAKATTLILGKLKPQQKIDILPTGEEEVSLTSPGNSDVSLNVSTTNTTKFTGVPQIDYIYDPNLPRELNGYNLTEYPFYNSIPEEIDFKCDGLHDGFYASVPHKCQVYHHCLFGTRYDFLCANYTAFDQKTFICHFASEVDCKNSPKYYIRNEALYKSATTTQAPAPLTSTRKPQSDTQSSNGRRRRPFRRRRPMYDYYDEYDDYAAEVEYADEGQSGYRRRKRPRPQGREPYTEVDDYEDEKIPPSAPSKSVYDRPRVAPKIRRPVPLNEREKYDYSSDSRVVSTSEAPLKKMKNENESNSKNQQGEHSSSDSYEVTGGGGSRHRGTENGSRNNEREKIREQDREYDREEERQRDRRPQKKRKRPDTTQTHSYTDYDEDEGRRPRPNYRDRPRYEEDYDYDDRPLRSQHRNRENQEYRRGQDYDRDRYYDRPLRNRDNDYERPLRNRNRNRDEIEDEEDERPSRHREHDDRPSRIRDNVDDGPSRNRDEGERPSRVRDDDNKPIRNREDDVRPSRNKDEEIRPVRNRDEDRPIRNRDKDDTRSREKDEQPYQSKTKDEEYYDESEEKEVDAPPIRQSPVKNEKPTESKKQNRQEDRPKTTQRPYRSRENSNNKIQKQKIYDEEENDNKSAQTSQEEDEEIIKERDRPSQRIKPETTITKNSESQEKRPNIQRMRITTSTPAEEDPIALLEEKPVPAPRPAYITKPENIKPERKNVYSDLNRKIPVVRRPNESRKKTTTSAPDIYSSFEKKEPDYYEDSSEKESNTKLEPEDVKDYEVTSEEKSEKPEVLQQPAKTARPSRFEGIRNRQSTQKHGSTTPLPSREQIDSDEKINKDSKLKVPLEEQTDSGELAPQAPKQHQTIIRRRPFLPSRGGNPTLPRGLMVVGIKAQRVEKKTNIVEQRGSQESVRTSAEDVTSSKETEESPKKLQGFNPYSTGSGIEFRTKVSASLGVDKPRLANPITTYHNPVHQTSEEDVVSDGDLADTSDTDYPQPEQVPVVDSGRKKIDFNQFRLGVTAPPFAFTPQTPSSQSKDLPEEEKSSAKTQTKGSSNINFRPTLKTTHFPAFLDVEHQPSKTVEDHRVQPLYQSEQDRHPITQLGPVHNSGQYVNKNPSFYFIASQQPAKTVTSNQKLGPQTFYSENPKFKTTLSLGDNLDSKTMSTNYNQEGLRQHATPIGLNDMTRLDRNRHNYHQNSDIKFPGDNLGDTDEYDVSLNDALQPISTLHPRNVQTGIFLTNLHRNVPIMPIKRKFQTSSQVSTPVRRQEYQVRGTGVMRNEPVAKGQRIASTSVHEKYAVAPPYYSQIQSRPQVSSPNNYYAIFTN